MLTAAETVSLLSKLSIELGSYFPPEEYARLIESPPDTVEAFTDAVFIAEGLNPQYVERRLYRQVCDKVAEAFQKHFNNDNLFDE